MNEFIWFYLILFIIIQCGTASFYRAKMGSVRTIDREDIGYEIKEIHCYTGLEENFELLKKIGEGSFGTVFAVREKTDNRLYAVKAIGRNKIEEKENSMHVVNELRTMSKMNSPFVLKLFGKINDHHLVGFVMELCVFGDLRNRIKEKVFLH